MPTDQLLETNVAEQGAAKVRWQAGQDALQRGDFATAQKHLFEALEFHPSAPAMLLDLALAVREDADLAPLWAERFVRAASDAQGRLKLDAPLRKQFAGVAGFETTLKPGSELAVARAAAIAEIARFVDKNKPEKKGNAARAILVRWAAELLLECGLGAPAPLAAVAPAVGKTQDAFEPDYQLVFEALQRLLQKKLPAAAPGDTPTTGPGADATQVQNQRVRAARILAGLRRQAAFKDLKGPPPPDLARFADEAQKVLDEHNAKDLAAARVWTIAELEALSPEAAVEFTRTHRQWRSPGIAMSTTGRYRIETVCGWHTLLGTAKTIELHHARLVSHYGSDPFLQRPGLVRIAPEDRDLETEGAPYWWAGGFQSGDRTTVRFAWSSIEALGHTLTHELTHRFDGVLRPFLPPWYGEGHADWTGGHYGRMAETQFTELAVRADTAAHTWYKGYGNRDKFEQLLKGEIEDYRDNYFAGYSLYAFLRSYPPEKPRYRSALDGYERNARGGQKDRIGYFTATFADGKQGRPASFDEVFADWQRFLRDCYEFQDERTRKPENAWVGKFVGLAADSTERVLDAPTWSWARQRHEPFFGQDHAVAATLLLHEAGEADATVAAGLWATKVDGWRPETASAMLATLRAGKNQDAAAAYAALAHRHFNHCEAGSSPGLLAALPRTKALLDLLEQRAQALATPSPAACAALVQDHGRLASLFGLEPLRTLPAGAPPALPRHLGSHGFTESSLTRFDERRVRGLWFTTAEGDLHVGREKPRDGTGTLDRAAHQRDAFVHTVSWQAPGVYTLRGRVHFTTSYASGAIVFGHTRRDRDLRLEFSTGDFDYATGRTDTRTGGGRVQYRLLGLWERDGNLPAGDTGGVVEVPPENPSFEFALHVRGPRVLVEINGTPLLRYAVHDGTPIEGHVGFAMGMGAIRVQQPTVQRRDGELGDLVAGLALDRQPACELEDLLLLPTRGIPVGKDGTLVLWLPKVADASPIDQLPRILPVLAKLLNTPHEHPQEWVLAVPKELPAAERETALRAIGDIRKQPMPVIEHVLGSPFDGRYPWVLFVDSQGVLRDAAGANEPKLHASVASWSRLFRTRTD